MGMLDKIKDQVRDFRGKAGEVVGENRDKITDGVGKATNFVDDKTKGKYSDKLGKVDEMAEKAVDKIDTTDGQSGETGGGPGDDATDDTADDDTP